MTVTTGRWARSTVARWAGGLYLAYILANVLASSLGHIGLSDAQTLRATISGDEVMFRWGLVAALSSALLFVLTAWALYTLRARSTSRWHCSSSSSTPSGWPCNAQVICRSSPS